MTWGGQIHPTVRYFIQPIGWMRHVALTDRLDAFWQKMTNFKVVDLSLNFPWPQTGGQTESVCSRYGQNGEGVSGTTSLPIILRFSFFPSFNFSFSFLCFILVSLEWQLHEFYLFEYTPRGFHLSGILRTCINLHLLIVSSSFSWFSLSWASMNLKYELCSIKYHKFIKVTNIYA